MNDLDLAVQAAAVAGEAVMHHFRDHGRVRFKGADQPVTDADLEADAVLRRILLGARPDDGWLSEESRDSPARLGRQRVWIVDPIDGTNSFVAGLPEFVVSVGLVVGGEPQVGVLHNPATGELYAAERGRGATLGGRPIRVAGAPPADENGIFVASRSELDRGELEEYRPYWTFLPLGSTAYRMAKVAEGAGHIFLSRGRKSEWDVCAGALIVREAGGEATQIDGAPLRFNQAEPVFDGIIASCGVSPRAPESPGRSG